MDNNANDNEMAGKDYVVMTRQDFEAIMNAAREAGTSLPLWVENMLHRHLKEIERRVWDYDNFQASEQAFEIFIAGKSGGILKKINMIKVVREHTESDLKAAKEAVESAEYGVPFLLERVNDHHAAMHIWSQIVNCGYRATITFHGKSLVGSDVHSTSVLYLLTNAEKLAGTDKAKAGLNYNADGYRMGGYTGISRRSFNNSDIESDRDSDRDRDSDADSDGDDDDF